MTRSLGYYVPTLLAQKFGVVVVDYAGLATPGGHRYMSARDNSEDVINAVPAARAAVPALSRSWVTIGHSQGGLAVWGAANLEASRGDPTYLGGVPLAPAVGGDRLTESVGDRKGQTLYTLYLAYSIKLQSPKFNVARMLTPSAMRYYEEVTTKGSWFIANALFTDAPAGSVLRAGWQDDPAVKRFFAPSFVARSAIDRPLFVATGQSDDAVPPALVGPVVARQKAVGGAVIYKVYPGDHETMLESSFADQIRWVRDRFAQAKARR